MKRSLLLLAHPGHELMLYGWLSRARPDIVLVTDRESGATRSSLDLSGRVAAETGARLVDSDHFAEADLFEMFRQGRTERLVAHAAFLADLIERNGIERIVTDAPEGYHTVHDLSLPLARAAIALHARRHRGCPIEHLEYRVVGDPRSAEDRDVIERCVLDDDTLSRKTHWLHAYAGELGPTMYAELEWLMDAYGEDAYRHEVLARAGSEHTRLFDGRRHYEHVGEQSVAEQRLDGEVIRHSPHMLAVEAGLLAATG